MWNINQLQIVQQHQRDLQNEAEQWRLAHPKDEYQPNRAIRRNKRKRNR